MRRAIPALLAVLTLLAVAPEAFAATSHAPPGQSAIDEYLETVPGAGGNLPAVKPGSGGPSGGVPLPARTRRQLRRLGPDGAAVAAVAAATTPATGAVDGTPPTPDAGRAPERAPDASAVVPDPAQSVDAGAPGAAGTLARAVVGTDGGWGAAYPALLVAILAAALVALLVRRRGGRPTA